VRPTLALLLLLVAGTLSGFWLLSSEDRTSAAARPAAPQAEASLEQEQEVPEGAVWYQGLDAEGRSRVVVVSRTTSPELYAQGHELDWLEPELARRGR